MGINDYQTNLENLIRSTQEKNDISHIKGINGEATWGDNAWQGTDAKGKSINLYFIGTSYCLRNLQMAEKVISFSERLRHVAMVYVLDTILPKKISLAVKQEHLLSARHVLQGIEILDDINAEYIKKLDSRCSKSTSRHHKVVTFIEWLQKKKLINPFLKMKKLKNGTSSGDEILRKRAKNIPSEKVLSALGAIFYDTIVEDEKKWDLHPLTVQRDAVACSMVVLCLAAPNRMMAEVPILDSQLLQVHTGKIDGKSKTVNYVNWKGSKGFKDNNNHILAVLAPAVERSLKYMKKATEPGRVLARFYTKPSAPLKDILLTFKPTKKNMNYIKPNLDQPINLLALGTLLGFYDGLKDKKIKVAAGTVGASKEEVYIQGKLCKGAYFVKEIAAITEDDVILVGQITSNLLFGYGIKIDTVFSNITLALKDMQRQWIDFATKEHPHFPIMHSKTKGGKVDARHALFALNGYQMKYNGQTFKGFRSFYSIIPPDVIGTAVAKDLSGDIFQKNNFSDEFRLTPHQLRHLLNDTGEKLGIPHEILNLWSGRVSPEQLLNYIYKTDAEKADLISDIMFKTGKVTEEEAVQSIRVVSCERYKKTIHDIASVTSTGVCVQNLTLTPCSYFNDFESQCSLCSSSCHVAHDEEAICFLQKDIEFQRSRLDDVVKKDNFHFSKGAQKWFKAHYKNTEALEQLVALMKDPNIKKGSIIRLVHKSNEFRITDLDVLKVECKPLLRINEEEELTKALALKTDCEKEDSLDELSKLLGMT